MDADTVNYAEGTWVWIQVPGQRLKAGVVTGHHPKSGKPMVRKAGASRSCPMSKVYLSVHPQNSNREG